MARKKNKYEKITLKFWKKKLGEELSERLIEIEKSAYPLSNDDWLDPKIAKWQKKNRHFCHLETDIEDDSLGVQPEQIQPLLNNFTNEEIIDLFQLLTELISIDEFKSRFLDFDGFISWEQIFHGFCNLTSMSGIHTAITKMLSTELASKQYARNFKLTFNTYENLMLMSEMELLPQRITNDLSLDSILDGRKKLWKETARVVPKIESLLLANPKNFSKSFIEKVKDVFDTKDLKSLSNREQKFIGMLLNNLGENIIYLDNDYLKEAMIDNLAFRSNFDELSKYPKKVFDSIKKSSDTLREIISNVSKLENNAELKELSFKKGSINKSDIEVLEYKAYFLNSLTADNQELLNDVMTFQLWKMVHRYGKVSSPAMEPIELVDAIKLFEKNKNNEQHIPIISGKVGQYTYEITKKSDPISLFLGYATDCCMVFGGEHQAGKSCLIAGYEREDSAFFVIKKKNDIYAQSWIWENDGLICFDSLEVLGKRSGNFSEDIVKCYQEAAKQLIDAGYTKVTVGADGNSTPQAIRDAGEYFETTPQELRMPFPNIYTDANEQIVVLEDASNEQA